MVFRGMMRFIYGVCCAAVVYCGCEAGVKGTMRETLDIFHTPLYCDVVSRLNVSQELSRDDVKNALNVFTICAHSISSLSNFKLKYVAYLYSRLFSWHWARFISVCNDEEWIPQVVESFKALPHIIEHTWPSWMKKPSTRYVHLSDSSFINTFLKNNDETVSNYLRQLFFTIVSSSTH